MSTTVFGTTCGVPIQQPRLRTGWGWVQEVFECQIFYVQMRKHFFSCYHVEKKRSLPKKCRQLGAALFEILRCDCRENVPKKRQNRWHLSSVSSASNGTLKAFLLSSLGLFSSRASISHSDKPTNIPRPISSPASYGDPRKDSRERKRFTLDTGVITPINSGWMKAPQPPPPLPSLECGGDYLRRGSVINARPALATWRRDGGAVRERVDIERHALYRLFCRLIHVLCSWASPISLQSRYERRAIERNVRIHHQRQSRPLMGESKLYIKITDTEAAKESVFNDIFHFAKKAGHFKSSLKWQQSDLWKSAFWKREENAGKLWFCWTQNVNNPKSAACTDEQVLWHWVS